MTIKHFLKSSVPDITIDESIYTIGLYHFNWHKEIEIFWLLNGRVEMNVEGKITYMQEDDIYIINSNIGHATFAIDSDTIAMRLLVSPSFFIQQGIDMTTGEFDFNKDTPIAKQDLNNMKYLLACLHKQMINKTQNTFKINALYFEITTIMLKYYTVNLSKDGTVSSKEKTNNVIKEVVEYIENNFKKDISLEQLSERFNYSLTYLSKIIKDELGINYHDYLTRCRLRYAVSNLSQKGKIGDIALDSGFQDIRAFNIMFRRYFGITPSQYREKLEESKLDKFDPFKKELNEYQIKIYKTKIRSILDAYQKKYKK